MGRTISSTCSILVVCVYGWGPMIFPLSVLVYLLIFRISLSHFTYTCTHTRIYIQFCFAHFCCLNSFLVPPSLYMIHMSLSVLQITPLFLSVSVSLCVCVFLFHIHTHKYTHIQIHKDLISSYERNVIFVVLPIFSSSLLYVLSLDLSWFTVLGSFLSWAHLLFFSSFQTGLFLSAL